MSRLHRGAILALSAAACLLAGCATAGKPMATGVHDQVERGLIVAEISLEAAKGVYAAQRQSLPADKVAKIDQLLADADELLTTARSGVVLIDGAASVQMRAKAAGELIGQALALMRPPSG